MIGFTRRDRYWTVRSERQREWDETMAVRQAEARARGGREREPTTVASVVVWGVVCLVLVGAFMHALVYEPPAWFDEVVIVGFLVIVLIRLVQLRRDP